MRKGQIEAGGQGEQSVEGEEGVEHDVGSEEAGEEVGAVVAGALVCCGSGGGAADAEVWGWEFVGEGEEGEEGEDAAVC